MRFRGWRLRRYVCEVALAARLPKSGMQLCRLESRAEFTVIVHRHEIFRDSLELNRTILPWPSVLQNYHPLTRCKLHLHVCRERLWRLCVLYIHSSGWYPHTPPYTCYSSCKPQIEKRDSDRLEVYFLFHTPPLTLISGHESGL